MAEVPDGCPTADIDPWSDEVVADPYPTYRTLRDMGPVVWIDRHSMPALARFDAVRAALTDHRRFSSAYGVSVDEARNQEMGESILSSDPPVHETYRRLLATQLTPGALAPDTSSIQAAADTLVARLRDMGTFDAVTDMASRFDVARNPLDQLAFGRGIHLCVGIHLARAEAHSLFNALVQAFRRFELVGTPVWKLDNTLHGLASLPVRGVPA